VDRAQLRENRRVWQTLASSFDRTRTKPWDAVREFVHTLPPSSIVLDAGAWMEGAIERLPVKSATFDAVMAMAVLHHVRGQNERIKVVQEMIRALKPGGRLLLSVWARDQPRFGPGKEPRVPADGRPVEPGDAHVQWTQHGHDIARYIHLYTWEEWRHELDAADAVIERIWPESIMTKEEPDNFFAIVRGRRPANGRHKH
jgi:SAM-dependent methyltransferase